MRRWIVQPGEALPGILDRMEDPDAIGQGRVFVGKQRVTQAGHLLQPGDEVAVYPPRPAGDQPRVLGERHGVAALFKPAALPTVADHRGSRCLLGWAAAELKRPGLHATSRLDVGVSGVVLVACDDRARERLARAREEGRYGRRYLGVGQRAPEPPEGRWSWPIGKARDPRHRAVGGRDATAAETRYRLMTTAPSGAALLSLEPQTGRTHQLRVHAAHAGLPLLGDPTYGGPSRLVAPSGAVTRLTRIALHAFRVEAPDADNQPWQVEAPAPDDFQAIWTAAGGEVGAW